MIFNGQYLTYQEYKRLGGTLILMPFNLLEFEVRRRIDLRTQSRLVNGVDIPQAVKLCEYELINSLEQYAKSKSNMNNVASESTDGYSVSYINASDISEVVKSKQYEIDDTITTYLIDVKYNGENLLYPGV